MKMFRMVLTVLLLLSLVVSVSYSSEESDANTHNIVTYKVDNQVIITWNGVAGGIYYDVLVTDPYGTYSNTFRTFDKSVSVALNETGIYKVSLQGFDVNGLPEYNMGYAYFPFDSNATNSNIDPTVLATLVANEIADQQKEIDKKVYKFRALWNSNWWSGLAVTNSADEILPVNMKVVVDETKIEYVADFTIQPRTVIKDQWSTFLDMIGLPPDATENGNYIVTMEVPIDVDVEAYILQIVDGNMTNLTKDSSIDHYTYITPETVAAN